MFVSIHTSKSADEATEYFLGLKSLEAYYSTDRQEFAGDWGGKGAEMLGLRGQFTDEAFSRLCHNLHPLTGEQLTPRMREDRRPGFDITFNVPKSVSLVWAWTKDERIIRALRQTDLDVLTAMQENAATRVRANGQKDGDRKTGVLAWAEIIHVVARPEGGIPDPHVHSHCYVFNVTWDPEEKRFKALQMGLIHEEAEHYQALATRRLQQHLEELGLKTVPTKHGFEIAGIERELNQKFSRRTKTIEEYAQQHGITDPVLKAQLGVMTRERKSKDLAISEIEPFWWANLTPAEEKALNDAGALLARSRASELSRQLAGKPIKGAALVAGEATASRMALGQKDEAWAKARGKPARDGQRMSMNEATRPPASVTYPIKVTDHDRRAVALAMEHLFERNSVVSELQLKGEALRMFSLQKATPEGIDQVVANAPLIRKERDGRMLVTTAEVLAEENRIADQCLFGQGRSEPINEFWKIRDEELTAEQQNAVSHVLNSRDFITGIAGNPGVGKTRILQEVKRGIEAGYHRVLALAPWGVTAHEVLRKDGFENAQTVAKLLMSEELQEQARGAVLLVDEAGLLSARDADRLIALAKELGSRLVFVGDTGQHHAVERGQAFDHLRKVGKMQVAEVTQIQRQRGPYKRVVEHVLAGDVEKSFKLLDKMDAIFELTLAERKIALAADYVAAIQKGETALVVAPTHAECRDVTEGIRETLKEKGLLKPAGTRMATEELSWSEAQKSDPAQYKVGQLVEINSPVKGFRLGEKLEVIGVRDDMVRVRGMMLGATKSRPLPLATPEAFSVHEVVAENGCQWEVLPNLSWTEAQRSDPGHYKPGLVVQINGHVKGFALGEQVEVIGKSDDMVRVRSLEGYHTKIKALPLGAPKTFSVHERETIEICEGDQIRITANGRTEDRHRLNNGSVFTVDYISNDGRIVLENGWRLSRNFKNMEYGYTLTSHAAQGKTVDRLFLAQSPELSSGASDLTQFLVSISRGSKGPKVYTTDVELLRDNVSEVRKRMMATELLYGEPEEITREESPVRTSAQLGTQPEKSAVLGNTVEQDCKREAEDRSAEWLGLQKEMAPEIAIEPEWAAKAEVPVPKPPEREMEMEMQM